MPIMPYKSWSLCLMLAAGLFPALPLPGVSAPAMAQSTATSRPLAVVLPEQSSGLNSLLLQVLRRELSGFEPTLFTGSAPADINALLADLPSATDETLQLGGQDYSAFEIRQLRQAQLLMVPRWSYTPITLSGPHPPKGADEPWTLRTESDLTLVLDVYRPGQAEAMASLRESFKPGKEIPIRDLDQLLKLVKDVSGVDVDINNSLHQTLVLDVLRKIPSFQQMMEQAPDSELANESVAAVTASGFRGLVGLIRQQKGFAGAGGVASFENNRIKADLAALKNGPSHIDAGYKILANDSEIGYARIRNRSGDTFELEPIIASRDPMAGDSLLAYPKLGLNLVLRGGTAPLWLNDPQMLQFGLTADLFFRPAVELGLEYDLAPMLGWPETYLTFGGGAIFALAAFPGTPSATAIIAELGLLKRFFIRQWIIDIGASGGPLLGLMSHPSAPFDTPMTFGGGGTARLGVSYQLTPEFILGLHTGFRYYGAGFWSGSPQPGFPAQPQPSLPLLTGFGPIVQLNASYTF